MIASFRTKILSIDKCLFEGDVTELNVPSVSGRIGILPEHIHYITQVVPGTIFGTDADKKEFSIAISQKGLLKFEIDCCRIFLL